MSSQIINETIQGEATLLSAQVESTGKMLYLESYGCAMNFADSEVVASILQGAGYTTTMDEAEADVIMINTCSIRDRAEQSVRTRLRAFKTRKKSQPELIIGVLGCMAERLKQAFLDEEKLVDLVVGPDAYRDLPGLIKQVEGGQIDQHFRLCQPSSTFSATKVGAKCESC